MPSQFLNHGIIHFMSDNQIVNEVNADVQEPVNSSDDGDTATATTNPPAENGDSFKQTPHDDFDWTIDKRNVSSLHKRGKIKVRSGL